MPPRLPSHSGYARHYHAPEANSQDHARAGRHAQPRLAQQQSSGHDYTLGHGGRQVRIGPVAFWICVGSLVVMAVWTATTATYFTFRDDVLTRLIARQADMQYAYEDRIAELRSQVDRATSRQLIDQEQFEKKLDQVMRRQSALESRAAALGNMPDMTTTGSVRSAPAKPQPVTNGSSSWFAPASERTTRAVAGMDGMLIRMQGALDKVERTQFAALASVEETYEARMKRMRGVFSDLGTEPGKFTAANSRGAQGGPFVPVRPPADAGAFERQLYRINVGRAQTEYLRRALAFVPYRKPLNDLDQSSSFGVRSDPFLGRPAMHTGLDFRGDTGDPVRATAAGKVVTASWNGGYGRMVEIEHNDLLTTRYAHLSEIRVKVGETVKPGQIIGEVGSSGRSTGPHLHYEVRIDGDAVDPTKYIRAGSKFGE